VPVKLLEEKLSTSLSPATTSPSPTSHAAQASSEKRTKPSSRVSSTLPHQSSTSHLVKNQTLGNSPRDTSTQVSHRGASNSSQVFFGGGRWGFSQHLEAVRVALADSSRVVDSLRR